MEENTTFKYPETIKPKESKNVSVKSGIFWFSVFILIVIISAVFANQRAIKSSLECETFGQCVTDLITKNSTRKNALPSERILRNELVLEESTVIDVIDNASPAVVSIIAKTVVFDWFNGPYAVEDGIGTGFIVDSSGIIITNSHVVDDVNAEFSVVLNDGTTYEVDKIYLDETTDLAIVEITARDLPVLALGDSDELRAGQTAIAIGNALGRFENTVTVGVVSGISRQLTASGPFGSSPKVYENVIQTDAALNPGNSGGPLLNSASQVIGINVATSAGADNIGFSIPVNTLKPILESYLNEGRIIRPYMGIAYTVISPDIANIRRLPVGAFIQRVIQESPADKAGLLRGDIITEINGEMVDNENSVSSIVNRSKVGDVFTMVIDREGDIIELELTLEESPQNSEVVSRN